MSTKKREEEEIHIKAPDISFLEPRLTTYKDWGAKRAFTSLAHNTSTLFMDNLKAVLQGCYEIQVTSVFRSYITPLSVLFEKTEDAHMMVGMNIRVKNQKV
jgi:hypothetical protein